MAAINKRKLLESAQKNLQKGALDKALKDYQTLLEADPRDANVRLKLGDLQLRRNQNDEAIAAYLKVADQFMRDGFDAKAVAIYKQITKIDAKRYDVYVPLADLYQRLGLGSEAMAALQTAAEAYQSDGRKREALDLLRRMAGLDPTNTTSRLKVAELLQQEGLASEALAEFEEAAAELGRQGDPEARAAVLERIVELAPDRADLLDAVVALWLEQRQPRRAEPFARRLVAIDAERAESQEALAQILDQLGDEPGAIAAYTRAADAWLARGDEDRARAIRQRHLPAESFDLGSNGLEDFAPSANGVVSRPDESPFGDEGIGGETVSLDGELSFGDAQPLLGDEIAQPLLPREDEPSQEPAPPLPARSASGAVDALLRETAAPEPGEAAASTAEDVEQLLAEAGVYLRYGKHERAVASLEAVLARDAANLAALEQLGEAHAGAGDEARGVEIWSRAAQLAHTAGDADRLASLRARIEAIDALAAAELPEPLPAADRERVPFAVAADAADEMGGAHPSDETELGEIEIDVDAAAFGDAGEAADGPDAGAPPPREDAIAGAGTTSDPVSDASPFEDLEIDIDAAGFGAPVAVAAADAGSAAAPEPSTDPDVADAGPTGADFSLGDDAEPAASPALADAVATPDVLPAFDEQEAAPAAAAADLSSEDGELPQPQLGGETETPTPAAEREPAAPAPSRADEISATSAQQILEELDEASFYFEQGLLDEAEAIYRRVVQRAPQHPAALLRLGEIAVARGQEPTSGGAPPPTVDTEDASADLVDIEPPDDLDLTARELGEAAAGAVVFGDADAHGAPDAALGAAADALATATAPGEATGLASGASTGFAGAPPASLGAEATGEAHALASPETAMPAVSPEPAARPAEASPHESDLTAPDHRAEDQRGPAFDLAAELSEALADEGAAARAGASTDEDGFASLFSEFKRGVSRTLGDADVETHFDLGIAYREMGLLDDAIGEFRHALGSSRRRLDALHMMGLCALDLARPQDAVAHLEQALAAADVPPPREVPLRFDLGRAYRALGDVGRALDAFRRVHELDAEFQDVAQQIEALACGEAETAEAEQPAAGEAEAYESFDDLVAETTDASASPDAEPVAECYESFDEFQSDEGAESEPQAPGAADAAAPAADPELDRAPEPAGSASALEPGADAVAPAPAAEPEAVAPPEPVSEPEPPEPRRRRRKVSFF